MLKFNVDKMKMMVLLLVIVVLGAVYFNGREQYKIPVLLYHHFLSDEENNHFINKSTMTPQAFEEQIRYLYDEGYETVTSDELYDYLTKSSVLEGKKVLITFDDGYLSNHIYAYEVLKKYNYTAMVFLITSLMPEEQALFDPDIITMMSIEEIELTKDVFEFGSHTHNMHKKNEHDIAYLKCLSKEDVTADIMESYTVPGIQKIFAYPYGEYKRETLKILKQLDTKMAFTVRRGYVTKNSNPYQLPRYSISRDTSFEEFKEIFQF